MTFIFLKRHGRIVFVAFVLAACSSCSPYVFPHAEPVKGIWDVAVKFDSTIAPATQTGINKELDRLVVNSRTTLVKFRRAVDTTDTDMMIAVKDLQTVRPGRQVLGVFSLILGVASAGLGFGFVALPVSGSTAQVYVYDGDNDTHVRRKTQFIPGPGFLKKKEKQFAKHSKGYRGYFRKMLRWYEKDLLNAQKKGRSTN